jgi:hypothetical protein
MIIKHHQYLSCLLAILFYVLKLNTLINNSKDIHIKYFRNTLTNFFFFLIFEFFVAKTSQGESQNFMFL